MTVLAGQSIRGLCQKRPSGFGGDWPEPLIIPFVEETVHAESGMTGGLSVCGYDLHVKDGTILWPGDFKLAVTVERLCLPDYLVGILHDKSTLARMGLAVQNTVAEPGWSGWLTLELSNHSKHKICVHAGQPIGQMLFHRLDGRAEQPYDGRYQDQGPEPQAALFLRED